MDRPHGLPTIAAFMPPIPTWERPQRRALAFWAARHLKTARTKADLTQPDLARRLGVSVRNLSMLERKGLTATAKEQMPASHSALIREVVDWISSVLGYGPERCGIDPCPICTPPKESPRGQKIAKGR